MLVLEAEATVAPLDLLNDISKRSRCWGHVEPALGQRAAPAGPGALRTSFFCSQSSHPQEKGNQGTARKGAAHGQLFVIWI